MTYLKYGTIVKLNQPPHLKDLVCKVVGRITEYQPIIGANYIVKPEDPSQIYSKEYPYDHMSAFECMFDVIEVPEWKNTRSGFGEDA